ncbi:BON domain-containing protein [Allorhodopirellula heiligendammensis]|uniref:BON domain protein n=1 Tax=Allorhodopirellula heiligendammensis TaxID=2714739 RepID=A0A5C6BY77_9BACT|nr:BON domain-containing protein [Allorhodopirellula heiligendammensis]TWU16617.1 BON domain protein [Allorhodopirellula heiligendammensis]
MNQTIDLRADTSVPTGTFADSNPPQVSAVEHSVRAALRRCGRRPIMELRCDFSVSAGDHVTVTLSGRLPSFYLNQLAQELVRRVPGVDQVCNRVRVDFPHD